VLSRFFHNWEQSLASITKDRVVRPFEWGLDWISAAPNGSAGPVLHRWVDEVMRDTGAFFLAPPITEYEFDANAGHLRFPSALTTPHPANNTVFARWFPAADEPPIGKSGARGRAVVVLPQWNSDGAGHIGLSRLLARCGVSALRLSLPYHDSRMPPELTRADYIVSANIARTVQVCRQAVLDARRAIGWLALQGYERIASWGQASDPAWRC
jgi:hypothetical protein